MQSGRYDDVAHAGRVLQGEADDPASFVGKNARATRQEPIRKETGDR